MGIADIKVALDFLESLIELEKFGKLDAYIDPALRKIYSQPLREMHAALREELVFSVLRDGSYAVYAKERRDLRKQQPKISDHLFLAYPQGSVGYREERCMECDAPRESHEG